jgi:hypothetical protein
MGTGLCMIKPRSGGGGEDGGGGGAAREARLAKARR